MTTATRPPRHTLSTAGSFLSVPSALDGAPEGVLHAFKMEIVPVSAVTQEPGKAARQTFSLEGRSDRALIDLGAVDPAQADLGVLERDCEILVAAIREHPDVVREAIGAVCGAGTGSAGITTAAAGLSRIGLTEQGTRGQGGGFVVLALAVVAILLVTGCETCQHPIGPEPEVPVSPGPSDAGTG